jgi:alkylation response protein AidB-like acyl-CoA dehydrogenase
VDFAPADTPEQQAFRQEVREWLKQHVPNRPGHPDTDENYAAVRKLGRELGEKGWLRPTAPVEYGGGGLSVDKAIVLAEEIDVYGLDNPPYYDTGGRLGGASILVHGTEEQKKRFLPPIFKGEVVGWQLLSGPEAGSDLASTKTDARRDGDEYVINGEKVFVGGSHGADYSWTICRTDPDGERHKNLSWFVIPMDLPGITVRPMELLGDEGERPGYSFKNTIYFDNVRVPAENLVGGENNGWAVAATHLELEHGAGGRAGHNKWLTRALQWSRELMRDGKPLIEDREARERLADLFVATEIQRLFELRNYWMIRSDVPMTYEGPQTSYYRKTTGLDITETLHSLLGPYALINDPEYDVSNGTIDAYLREAIVALHPGGTADIQKVIMARRIGIGRAQRESAGKTME